MKHAALLALVASSGCASWSGKGRFALGAGLGAAAGASGGAYLSPNAESRVLNALVFGLSGALLGGTVGILSGTEPPATPELKMRELSAVPPGRDYVVVQQSELPEFVRSRVQPLVIEEFLERDQITDEGTLHEPHRAYRIKRPVELSANPVTLPSPKPPLEVKK